MGIGRVTSINYSHGSTQNQTQGGQCIVGALLVLGQATHKFGLTRLITTRTWGKPPPSPLQYTLCLCTRPTSNWHFVPKPPSGNPEIPTTGTLATLGPHNFVHKPPIEMRSRAKLQPSLRSFQWYVARHLHTSKSGRFLTSSGRESNCQIDSQPFFWP